MFIHLDQHDSKMMEPYRDDPAAVSAVAAWVRETLAAMPGAFSTNSGHHVGLTNGAIFLQEQVSGVTYREVLANWYFGRDGSKNVIAQP